VLVGETVTVAVLSAAASGLALAFALVTVRHEETVAGG
jgi:hypothetical protein